jgi:hypothetical protein
MVAFTSMAWLDISIWNHHLSSSQQLRGSRCEFYPIPNIKWLSSKPKPGVSVSFNYMLGYIIMSSTVTYTNWMEYSDFQLSIIEQSLQRATNELFHVHIKPFQTSCWIQCGGLTLIWILLIPFSNKLNELQRTLLVFLYVILQGTLFPVLLIINTNT